MANTLSLYRGEHKIWLITVTEASVAFNLTGATLRWVVRQDMPGASPLSDTTIPAAATDALLVKTSAALGGITINAPETAGIIELELKKADTNTWSAPLILNWELAILPAGATEYIVGGQGQLLVKPDISRGD